MIMSYVRINEYTIASDDGTQKSDLASQNQGS